MPRAATAARPTAPAARGSNDLLQVPAGLHPNLSSMAADASALHGQFDPQSFPDLAIYMGSYHDALLAERDKWKVVGDNLVSAFPGFNLAAQFADRVELGYAKLAQRAANIHAGFKAKHAADYARFEDPRVNEHYADVDRWGGRSNGHIPTLSTGGVMHGSHIVWLTSCDMNLVGYHPEEMNERDRVTDLRAWLHSLGPFYAARAQYAIAFTNNLVQGFPIEEGVADFTRLLAVGYANLADFAGDLVKAYEARNPHDIARRDNPKPNEYKRDVGNTAMTNDGRR